jgi:hypothetical protein
MCDGRIANAVPPAAHQKAHVCICVFGSSKPVKLISRAGGDWSILCGDMHPDSADYYRAVCIGHEFQKDPTLLEVIDLAPEWDAERSYVGAEWTRTPSATEEDVFN